MKLVRLALAALALAALSACYTSRTAVVTDELSVTPYDKLTFENESGEALVFTRERTHYVTTSDNNTVFLNLLPVEGDFYVAQLSGNDPGKPTEYLYGYLMLDVANGQAKAWRTRGSATDARPGLSECENRICIDDINAYIAYAKEAVSSGLAPEMTMPLTVE